MKLFNLTIGRFCKKDIISKAEEGAGALINSYLKDKETINKDDDLTKLVSHV
jgi:hypothetical protein